MRISELIFQGVMGINTPNRLRPDGPMARIALPGGVTARSIQEMILACLYPVYFGDEDRERLKMGRDAKLAAVLETRHGVVRVIRKAEASSVRLQRKTAAGYEDVAAGSGPVQQFLQEKLDLPELKLFLPLHLWRFGLEEFPGAGADDALGASGRTEEISQMYLTSLEVESLEDQLKELEVQVREGQSSLGQGAELEQKLARAREKLDEIRLDEISAEDLAKISRKEKVLQEYREQLDRLRDEEDEEVRQVREILPERPTHVPLFWVGVAIASLALVASVVAHETHRMAALGVVPGLGIGSFLLLQYFQNMSRASVHQVRLSSIRRRINQVIQEEIFFMESIDHLVLHAGAKNEEAIQDRIPMVEKLKRIVARLEEQVEELQVNPEFRRAQRELNDLRTELNELRARRKELPDFVMSSFQLENDLQSIGINPVEVRKEAESKEKVEEKQEDGPPTTSFQWLREAAKWTGQWNGEGLDAQARSIWSKICGHVLSDRFADVDLSEEGELRVGALTEEQVELWQRTRSAEVNTVLAALALALQVNHHHRSRGKSLSSVWIEDPAQAMTSGHAQKFESVFQSAARKSQIVVCEQG